MMERVGALEAAKAALSDQLAEQSMRLEMVQGDYAALQERFAAMVVEHGVSEPATPLLPSDGIARAASSDNAMRLPVSTSPVVMSGRPQDLPGSVGSSGGGGTSADIEDSSRRVLGLTGAVSHQLHQVLGTLLRALLGPGVGPGLLPPMLGRDVVSTSQRAVDTLDQAGQALGQLLTYLTKLDGELPGLMARAPPPAASSHAGHAAGGGVSAHSTPSLGFTGGPDSDARPYSSGGDDPLVDSSSRAGIAELLSPWGLNAHHPKLRRWLNTASATIGTGNLELAERLVLRNRQLGQMKAESLVRVIQLNEQLAHLKQRRAFDPSPGAREQYTGSLRSVAESLRTERALLTGILEEREHNMILIMNAFSRVGKLAQSIFSLPVFNMAAEPSASIHGLPEPERFSAAEPMNIIGEGLFGQLPRVYGYGMLPSSQRLQFLLSALSQSLGDSPPAEEEPLEAAVTVVPMGSQRSLSPASPLGASPRLALGLGTSKPSRRLRKELHTHGPITGRVGSLSSIPKLVGFLRGVGVGSDGTVSPISVAPALPSISPGRR